MPKMNQMTGVNEMTEAMTEKNTTVAFLYPTLSHND